jgi:hypothetical protein
MAIKSITSRVVMAAIASLYSAVYGFADEVAPPSTWLTYEEKKALGQTQEVPEEEALPVNGWLTYPSFLTSVVFNDNVFATKSDPRAALGMRFRPKFRVTRGDDIHSLNFKFDLDTQIYPDVQFQKRYLTGHADASYIWSPADGFRLGISGKITRDLLLNSPAQASFLASAGVFYTSLLEPNSYRRYTLQEAFNFYEGSVFAERNLDLWYLRAFGGWQRIEYDAEPSVLTIPGITSGSSSNNQSINIYWNDNSRYFGLIRAGHWISPMLSVFTEGGINQRYYLKSSSNSRSTQLRFGIETDPNNALRAEAYSGYQSFFLYNITESIAAPAAGARLSYNPLPSFLLSARYDQSITWGTPNTIASATVNSSSKASFMRVAAELDYSIAPNLLLRTSAEYSQYHWISEPAGLRPLSSGGQTNATTYVLGINYEFLKNAQLNFEYRGTTAFGCADACQFPGAVQNPLILSAYKAGAIDSRYSQSLFTLGVAYRY